MRYVIVGVGAAGMTAAKEIRSRDEDAHITMIAPDEHVHSRCMLHKYLSHERDAKGLNFTEEDFFDKYRIVWKKESARKIDVEKQKVLLSSGEETGYDKLLIASGANSFIPPVGDFRKAKNVFGLRHLKDAKGIDEMAKDAEHILIVGSGLVGLDAAYGLLEQGKMVSIVEMAPQILPVQLDAHAALEYQKRFEKAGAKFYLGCKAQEALCTEDGMIRKVTFDTGESVECDMIIVAAGVRPAVEFLDNSKIAVERGVCVDEYMCTNVPNVYAAGDVAGLSGIWPNAMKQGKTAAQNMCGALIKYEDRFAMKNTMNFFGLTTLCLGLIREEDGDVVFWEEDSKNYRRAIVRDGNVVGILLQGDISNTGIWQYIIKNKVNVGDIGKDLFRLTFADFYGTGERGKYVWTYES